jgi:hypothetical protein
VITSGFAPCDSMASGIPSLSLSESWSSVTPSLSVSLGTTGHEVKTSTVRRNVRQVTVRKGQCRGQRGTEFKSSGTCSQRHGAIEPETDFIRENCVMPLSYIPSKLVSISSWLLGFSTVTVLETSQLTANSPLSLANQHYRQSPRRPV